MSGRQSAATERALGLIGKPRGRGKPPHTAYSAAKTEGLSLSTIYRALASIRKAKQ
jgi:hypothetical protein